MSRPVVFTDESLIEAMQEAYSTHGFAKVSSVAANLGMSRVYLSQRLTRMVRKGTLTSEQLHMWRNPAARSQANGASNRRLAVRLTPENYEWLKTQPYGASEIINGLINKSRE